MTITNQHETNVVLSASEEPNEGPLVDDVEEKAADVHGTDESRSSINSNASINSTSNAFEHPGLGKWRLVEHSVPGPIQIRSGEMEIRREDNNAYVTETLLVVALCCLPCLSFPMYDKSRSGGQIMDGGRKFIEQGPRGNVEIEYVGNYKCLMKWTELGVGSATLEWEKIS